MSKHHILLLDIDSNGADGPALATAAVKKKKYPNAKILTILTIKDYRHGLNIFKVGAKTNQCKLHISAHGDKGKFSSNHDIRRVAGCIRASGLPNAVGAKVALHTCHAGVGDGTLNSVAQQIKTELSQRKNYGSPCHIMVQGAVDVLFPGWNQLDPSISRWQMERKTRFARDINKLDEYDDEANKAFEKWYNYKKEGPEWVDAEAIRKSISISSTPQYIAEKAREYIKLTWEYWVLYYNANKPAAYSKTDDLHPWKKSF